MMPIKQLLGVLLVTVMVSVLFNVKVESFLFLYSKFSFLLGILEIFVCLSLLKTCTVSLVESVIQASTTHAIEAELILTLRTLHVKASTVFENRSFALWARFCKEL